MSWLEHLLVAGWLACLGGAAAFGVGALVTRLRAGDDSPPTAGPPLDVWPAVTVQIPVCDDGALAAGAVAAVAALDYPRDRLDVQLCDDSSDPASIAVCTATAAAWAARGLPIRRLVRADRRDFKAGNLNHGSAHARGAYLAIFDSDGRPPPDFLRRTLPLLIEAPEVAAVQSYFTHANAEATLLTRAYALVYDFHLRLEQAGRDRRRSWVEFMGSAGIWRRTALDDIGGWPVGTGTEDVHASVLAQARGWRIRYSAATACTARLPETPAAFRRQQARWARGMGWITRRYARTMLAGPVGWDMRLTGLLHVTGYLIYVAMAGTMLLAWPVVRTALRHPELAGLDDATSALFAIAVLGGGVASAEVDRRAGRGPLAGLRAGLLMTFVNTGVAVLASRAYILGLLGAGVHEWVPTAAAGSATRIDRAFEAAAVLSAAAATVAAWAAGRWFLPLPALLYGGCTLLFLLQRGPRTVQRGASADAAATAAGSSR